MVSSQIITILGLTKFPAELIALFFTPTIVNFPHQKPSLFLDIALVLFHASYWTNNEIQRVHRLGQKRRNKENPRPIIARFVSYKKRNEFLTNKRELKNIEGRQHVFVCEDLTPLRYKLLKYMQKSCSDTFTSCYTRNGNIKAKLKATEKWVTVTSPDDLFKYGIDVDFKQMGCDKILSI